MYNYNLNFTLVISEENSLNVWEDKHIKSYRVMIRVIIIYDYTQHA